MEQPTDACKHATQQGRGRVPPPVATRWKPGVCPNPSGRPKGVGLTKIAARILRMTCARAGPPWDKMATDRGMDPAKTQVAVVWTHRLLVNAASGNSTAIRELLDRQEGKVAEHIVHSEDTSPLAGLSVEELRRIADGAKIEPTPEAPPSEAAP